jgi:hypothetical protein
MMGVFAEFERAMIRERVLPGLARARQVGTPLGRKFTEDTKEGSRKVKAVLAVRSYRKIAKELGLGVATVMRLTASRDISRPFEGASGGAPSGQTVTSAAPVRVLSAPVRAARSISGRGRACNAAQAGNAA